MHYGADFDDDHIPFQSFGTPSTTSREQLVPSPDNSLKRAKPRQRIIFKNGDCNVCNKRLMKKGLRFLHDTYTLMMEIQWRWTLFSFSLVYVVSWLLFALIWWLIVFCHGDLEDEHLPSAQADSGWQPCIINIYNYTSCFLFSMETQFTTGYGVRVLTEECPEAIFLFLVQFLTGTIIDSIMVGILFAKMTRPKLHTTTLLFSKNAVICQREQNLYLMFRIGDISKSHIIGGSIRVLLARTRKTKEGEVLNNYTYELDVKSDDCGDNLFLIWPLTIVHKIDENSPLYKLRPEDLAVNDFEILVVLEGTVESTGQSTQARTSYLSTEILWGRKFESLLSYIEDKQYYDVDYAKFHSTYSVDTPMSSAEDLDQFSSDYLRPPVGYQDEPKVQKMSPDYDSDEPSTFV